jgi:hypothetical protein
MKAVVLVPGAKTAPMVDRPGRNGTKRASPQQSPQQSTMVDCGSTLVNCLVPPTPRLGRTESEGARSGLVYPEVGQTGSVHYRSSESALFTIVCEYPLQ